MEKYLLKKSKIINIVFYFTYIFIVTCAGLFMKIVEEKYQRMKCWLNYYNNVQKLKFLSILSFYMPCTTIMVTGTKPNFRKVSNLWTCALSSDTLPCEVLIMS